MTRDSRTMDWMRGVGLDVEVRRGERELLAGVSGCSWYASAICGEYARKLSRGETFSLVTGLPPMDCKSIA